MANSGQISEEKMKPLEAALTELASRTLAGAVPSPQALTAARFRQQDRGAGLSYYNETRRARCSLGLAGEKLTKEKASLSQRALPAFTERPLEPSFLSHRSLERLQRCPNSEEVLSHFAE